MKGRHTAFQRFGSGSHNPFGSVLNKYFLTEDTVRKNNIYEKTADGRNVEEPDLGEEVYGCLAKGINTQGHLEYDYDDMTKERKTRKDVGQYAIGSEGSILRTWEDKNNKTHEDSVLIPQESLPLNVISKYPIKYSYDFTTDGTNFEVKDVDVPPSAGFSGPFVYRPHKFPSGFIPVVVKQDCIMLGDPIEGAGYIYSVPVSSVSIPAGVAHQIINCTKEIKVTGSLDHSVEAKNKKCTGSSTQTVTQTYYIGAACPGKQPMSKTRTASYSCTSSSETTTLQVNGSIDGTMSRYNLLTSLWEEPVKLDLSPNFYQGSNAKKAYNFSVRTGLSCEAISDSGSAIDELDYLKVKMLGDREKVTKLEAGCAVTPTLDIDIIRRDMGKNLLRESANNSLCVDGGAIIKTFTQLPDDVVFFWGGQKSLLAPKTNNFTSGPVLCARYGAGLAEYVGVDEEELVYKPTACSDTELESFRSPKGNPISTGLKLTMKGNCPNNVNDNSTDFPFNTSEIIKLYDATDSGRAYYQWEDQDGCYGSHPGCCAPCSVYGDQGTYKLRCEAEKQCYDNACQDIRNPVECPVVPHPSGSDLSEVTSNCNIPYSHSLMLGRFAQTAPPVYTIEGLEYIPATEIPFDTDAKYTDDQDLSISFILNAGEEGRYYSSLAIPQHDYEYASFGVEPIIPIISTCKKWHESEPDRSGFKKSVNQVGALTLKSGDWSTLIPLWTATFTAEATDCEGTDVRGIGGHDGWITACERTTVAGCSDECECCCGGECNGCGSQTSDNPCNKAVPCEPKICTYSYSSSFTGTEDCPKTAQCNGCQDCGGCRGNCDHCACCGCNCGNCSRDGDFENPCPPHVPTPPTTHSGGGRMGCYGSAREEQVIETKLDVTLEFIPFTEVGGVKQK